MKLSCTHVSNSLKFCLSADIPLSRWDIDNSRDKSVGVRFGSFLSSIEYFDPSLFSIKSLEAKYIDPQQRLLLENVARISSHGLPVSTAITVGIGTVDYLRLAALLPSGPYFAAGSANSVAAGRLSYTFSLKGASVSIDTACSSSLVALHCNISEIQSFRSVAGIVSGVNVILDNLKSNAFFVAGMLASDGRCKTIDAEASGYVRAESCTSLLISSSWLEESDSKTEYIGLIKNSCVNQDGRSNGLTAPNGNAQQALLLECWSSISDQEFQLTVELHGTGTSLGDPIEIGALFAALKPSLLVLSASKTRIGHSETGAGTVGVLHALQRGRQNSALPINHLRNINKIIGSIINANRDIGVSFSRENGPVPHEDDIISGISAFAFQGTNAHTIIQQHKLEILEEPKNNFVAQKILIWPLPEQLYGGITCSWGLCFSFKDLQLPAEDLHSSEILGASIIGTILDIIIAKGSTFIINHTSTHWKHGQTMDIGSVNFETDSGKVHLSLADSIRSYETKTLSEYYISNQGIDLKWKFLSTAPAAEFSTVIGWAAEGKANGQSANFTAASSIVIDRLNNINLRLDSYYHKVGSNGSGNKIFQPFCIALKANKGDSCWEEVNGYIGECGVSWSIQPGNSISKHYFSCQSVRCRYPNIPTADVRLLAVLDDPSNSVKKIFKKENVPSSGRYCSVLYVFESNSFISKLESDFLVSSEIHLHYLFKFAIPTMTLGITNYRSDPPQDPYWHSWAWFVKSFYMSNQVAKLGILSLYHGHGENGPDPDWREKIIQTTMLEQGDGLACPFLRIMSQPIEMNKILVAVQMRFESNIKIFEEYLGVKRLVRPLHGMRQRKIQDPPGTCCVVAGGSRGIGYELAYSLSNTYDLIVVTSRSGDLEHTKKEKLMKGGASVTVRVCDWSDENSVKEFALWARETLPYVSCIVHSSGIIHHSMLIDMTASEFNEVFRTKTAGIDTFSKLQLPTLRQFLLSSTSAFWSQVGSSHYASANEMQIQHAYVDQSKGLPATAICFGPFRSVGMTAHLGYVKELKA